MSKMILALLTVAAFGYACWLVLTGRPLPDPRHATGFRRRFYLATLLVVGFLGVSDRSQAAQITCYVIIDNPPATWEPADQRGLAVTLSAAWRTLDAKQSDEFRQKLEAAVGQGAVRPKTAAMLAVAYAELADHKDRTQGEGRNVTCYLPTRIEAIRIRSRMQAFKELELLAKARKAGAIDGETASKAHAALAREIEVLYRGRLIDTARDAEQTRWLIEEYDKNLVRPSVSAETAAQLVVEMEGGRLPAAAPGRRLLDMRKRIDDLFKRAAAKNDWWDPAITPGMVYILTEAGLLRPDDTPRPTCYSRSAGPVRERSEELAALQARLLGKHAQDGTLDGETYKKIKETQRREQAELEAHAAKLTEADVDAYQKKVAGMARKLYDAGELPPSFLDELEEIVGCEIVDLKPGEALRAEMGFYLRGRLYPQSVRQILAWMEERKLISPARNHRGEMTEPGAAAADKTEDDSRINALKAALDRNEDVVLPGDADVRIRRAALPQQELDYRLRMRRVVRILLKDGLLDKQHDRMALQECLGVPIVGTIVDMERQP